MAVLTIAPPYPLFTDIDGTPLDNGYVYIGQPYLDPQTNPITVYWDAALTIPAAQPLRTLNGYFTYNGTPANAYLGSDYSMRINNKNNAFIYSFPSASAPTIPGSFTVDRFSGDGIQSTFILSVVPGTTLNTQVYIDGVYQNKDTYVVSGSSLQFSEAPPLGTDNVEVVMLSTYSVGVVNADNVIYDPAGAGAVATTVQTKLRQFVSASDFGAVGDGIVDDTVALQKAIDYCIGTAGTKTPTPLLLTGKYLITAPLNIDMPTGSSYDINGFFLIQGHGAGAGIYADTAINMISTTLTGAPTIPTSKNIQFENVTFEISDNTLAAYVLDDLFVNLRFISCTFQKIKCVNSTNQIFLYLFQNCSMLDWKGTWFSSYLSTNGPTTIKFLENWFFTGDTAIYLGLGCPSFVCSNNTFEGLEYSPIKIDGGYGGVISGNHFENNCLTGDSCNINVYCDGPISAYGMMIAGNYFNPTAPQRIDPTYFDIDARFANGLSVQGNFTAGEQLINTANAATYAVFLAGNVQGAVANNPLSSAQFTQVKSSSQISYGANIANDGVYSFTLGTSGAVIIVSGTGTSGNCGVIAVYPNAPTASCSAISIQANMAVTTGVLNGTTGSPGAITVSAATDGKIYIENRLGSSLNTQIQVLAAG